MRFLCLSYAHQDPNSLPSSGSGHGAREVRAHRTKAGVETDRITDTAVRTTVTDHGRTVDEVVEKKTKHTVPKSREKKGFFERLFERP